MDHVKHEIMHDFMLIYTLLDSVFLARVPVGQYSFFVDSGAFDTDRASHTCRQLLIYSKYFKLQEGGRQAINSPERIYLIGLQRTYNLRDDVSYTK